MKICVLSPWPNEEKSSWRTTEKEITDNLNSIEGVDAVSYSYCPKLLNTKWYKFVRMFVYTWNSPQDILIRSFYKRQLKRVLDDIQCQYDVYLFLGTIGCYIAHDKIKERCVAYTDCYMPDLNAGRSYKPLKYISSFFYKRNLKTDLSHIIHLFTQNEWSRDRFSLESSLAIESVTNVHFGVNLELLSEVKDYSEELILIVLRKEAEQIKGLPLLLNAFEIVKKERPKTNLAIVGSDTGEGINGVTCYFNKPRAITVDLFKKASIYVMPAVREPNGITYLEALANRVPIIGLNKYAFPEFSGQGEWGFISENTPESLAETICNALDNKKRLHDMGVMGQQYVKQTFLWSKTTEAIVSALRDNGF